MSALRVLRSSVEEGRRTRALHLAAALLLPVPFLLVAHQLHAWELPGFGSRRWDTNTDRSVIEVFGYAQVLAAAVVTVVLWRRGRGRVYAAWGFVLTLVLLDDALELHERDGLYLAKHVALPAVPGLREREVGQLLTWAGLGAVALLVLVVAHRHSPPEARRDSWRFGGLLALLMVFAVGFDMAAHPIASVLDSDPVRLLLVLTEAGGEVVSMTALLAFAVHVLRCRGASTTPVAYPDALPQTGSVRLRQPG